MSRFALLLILFVASSFAQNSEANKVKENDPPADVPATALRSTFLMMGNRAGQQAVWKSDDGMTHVLFEFNDRGRGPRTVTDYRINPDGVVVSSTTRGHDYLKASSDETFSRNADGSATWKNRSENGQCERRSAIVLYRHVQPARRDRDAGSRRARQRRFHRSSS